ncbi:DEAD/DEAH box helicase family protein [Sphaerimonospora thailandensis]|uniref:Uncharacterized protein n=1 Tax=Sphaerimonospora thailandensis TaxID=795644 RepID=A0A8J3VYK3_9ACTN|nr:hypothetical protein [Sphaerimonospora thailandensis]GIH69001.1 hypothetical protein Mth01_12540 [Sphaerimonospora thailandensis]
MPVEVTPGQISHGGSHGISMWGAPGSGKTTFLAALSIALSRRNDDWKIVGSDPASTDYLIDKTSELSGGRVFPEASKVVERYHWMLIGPTTKKTRWWSRKPKLGAQPRIRINMIDAPGGLYASGGRTAEGLADLRQRELLDSLTQGRGIVFLFDPIREFKVGDAFDHLHAPLTRLAERMLAADEMQDGKLPHHIAVCITKFDDRRVLDTAMGQHLINVEPDDPYGFPKVSDEDAPTLFRELCRISRNGHAELVLNTLGKFFHPDRIQFFVTSSIGFFMDRHRNVFDWDDSENLLPQEPGQGLRVRGQVRPINVVEPMLWLGQRLAATNPAGVIPR